MHCWLLTWAPILTPLLALGVSIAALLVSIAALYFLIRYTQLTQGIERAAQEQAEATQKPVIVLQCVPREDGDVIMERIAQRHVPQAGMLKVTSPHPFFVVTNIGCGPALNLSYDFVPIDSKDPAGTAPSQHATRFPYVGPKDILEATIGPDLVTHQNYRFTAHFESLSGKKYKTEMILHGRAATVTVLRGDWTFKPI